MMFDRHCTCISNFFGVNAKCFQCHGGNVKEHESCICEGRTLQNCYPVYDQKTPGSVVAVLACPPSSLGERSACNPNGNALLNADGTLPSTGWCLPGHTGRLCSQCESGYYRRGGDCYECPGSAVRALATALQIGVCVLIFIYYYVDSELTERKASMAQSAAVHIVTFHAQFLGLLVSSQFLLPASFLQLLSFSSSTSSFSVCCPLL
jgi:hypothetical protein